MIKIRVGNTRVALILFSFLVIKFPNPRFDWWKISFQCKKSWLGFILGLPKRVYLALLYGVAANVSEALLSCWNPDAEYLVPVFSLGLLNFQRYMGEDCPSHEEMMRLWDKLSPKLNELLFLSDCHERGYHNWRRTSKGLKLIDYGLDPLRTPWASFLKRAIIELTALTATK